MTELAGDLLREDTGTAKVLTVTFASVLTSKSSPGTPDLRAQKIASSARVVEESPSTETMKTQFVKILSSQTPVFHFHYFEQRRLDLP